MAAHSILDTHPYVTDVLEWLSERRRFSNIRHPFRKADFENKILNQVCYALGSNVFVGGELAYPTTSQTLSRSEHLLNFVSALLKNHSAPGQTKVDIKKAWLTPETKEKFKVRLEALLADFESSTCHLGEPELVLNIQTTG